MLLSHGRRITSLVHNQEKHYHSLVCLLFDDGRVLNATSDEHCLAHLFDCFTLKLEKSVDIPQSGISLSPVFEIEKVFALVRDEWLIPAPELAGETIGNNPHYQDAGPPGSAPAEASAAATCLAGVLLAAVDGRQLAILTALNVPLNVDVVMDAREVENIVNSHECRLLGVGDEIGKEKI
jgi:hypothetical protein